MIDHSIHWLVLCPISFDDLSSTRVFDPLPSLLLFNSLSNVSSSIVIQSIDGPSDRDPFPFPSLANCAILSILPLLSQLYALKIDDDSEYKSFLSYNFLLWVTVAQCWEREEGRREMEGGRWRVGDGRRPSGDEMRSDQWSPSKRSKTNRTSTLFVFEELSISRRCLFVERMNRWREEERMGTLIYQRRNYCRMEREERVHWWRHEERSNCEGSSVHHGSLCSMYSFFSSSVLYSPLIDGTLFLFNRTFEYISFPLSSKVWRYEDTRGKQMCKTRGVRWSLQWRKGGRREDGREGGGRDLELLDWLEEEYQCGFKAKPADSSTKSRLSTMRKQRNGRREMRMNCRGKEEEETLPPLW